MKRTAPVILNFAFALWGLSCSENSEGDSEEDNAARASGGADDGQSTGGSFSKGGQNSSDGGGGEYGGKGGENADDSETSTGGMPLGGAPGDETGGRGGDISAGGNDATGVGGGEPASRPSLVSSSEGAPWQVGDWTESEVETPEMVVERDKTHQRWSGFGGIFSEMGWHALGALDEDERARAIRLLFDDEGAHFVLGRLPIGASEYALERYSLNDVDGDYAMESFSIDRDREMLLPYVKAALAHNPDLGLWGVPWSPPAWMKDNRSMDNGELMHTPEVLSAYALYLARYVEEYAAEGITVEGLFPQNEPSIELDYPSCFWTADIYTEFVRDYLGPTFTEREVPAEIWLGSFGEMEGFSGVKSGFSIVSTLMADSAAAGYIKGIGLQWSTVDAVAEALSYDLPVMHTQHLPDNSPWDLDFQPEQAPNDYKRAEQSWELIKEWIDAGVSSYFAWNMVLDTIGNGLSATQSWPKSALLVVDQKERSLRVTPAYYVFRHLSYFIDVGATRIEASGGSLESLVFENPDGGVVAVLYNSSDEEESTTLGIDGSVIEFSVPAQGWTTINWH